MSIERGGPQLSRRDLLRNAGKAGMAGAIGLTLPDFVIRSHSANPNTMLQNSSAPEAQPNSDFVRDVLPATPGSIITHGDQAKPTTFIEIHDCYSAPLTQRSLDIARDYGVKFTYGPVGNLLVGQSPEAKKMRSLVRRASDEQHGFFNHTFDHIDLTQISQDDQFNQILKAHRALQEALGFPFKTNDAVPPFGAGGFPGAEDYELASTTRFLNLTILMWNVDTFGWNGATVNQIVATSTPVQKGQITAMHANPGSNDITALPKVLDSGLNNGLEFKTIKNGVPHKGTGL